MKLNTDAFSSSPYSSIKRSASDLDDYDELGSFSKKETQNSNALALSERTPCLRCLKGMINPRADVAKCMCVFQQDTVKSNKCTRCYRSHSKCDAVPENAINEAKAVQHAVARIQNGEIVDNYDMIAGACRAALKLPVVDLTIQDSPHMDPLQQFSLYRGPPQAKQQKIASFFRRPVRQVAIDAAPRIAFQASFEADLRALDKISPPSSQNIAQPISKKEREESPKKPLYLSAGFGLLPESNEGERRLKEERAALETNQLELSKKITQLELEISEMEREKMNFNGVILSLNEELTGMGHFDAKRELRQGRMSIEEEQCDLNKLIAEKEKEVDALEAEKAVKQHKIDRISKQLSKD